MFGGSVARLRERVSAVQKQLRASEKLRAAAAGSPICNQTVACDRSVAIVTEVPDPTEWRVIDHCSAVTRLYALYEQFAHEMLREHLSLLEQRRLFTELPPAFQTAYRSGVARILEKKDGPRYQRIALADLIAEFQKALAGVSGYRLEPLALIVHDQNLRLSALTGLYRQSGVENLDAWIAGHPEMQEFFKQDRLHANAETELKALVEYRNDAAHGAMAVSDVLSIDALCELGDFIVVLCSVLSERVQQVALHDGCDGGHSLDCGEVSETFKDGHVAIASVTGTFAVGGSIYLSNDVRCVERRIQSIQLAGIDQASFTAQQAVELGFAASQSAIQ